MGEGHSVKEMQGTETGPGGGLTPCSLSPGLATHTHGAPKPLAGEVVSVTQDVKHVNRFKGFLKAFSKD